MNDGPYDRRKSIKERRPIKGRMVQAEARMQRTDDTHRKGRVNEERQHKGNDVESSRQKLSRRGIKVRSLKGGRA